jgi:hypothetical protein
MIRLLKTSSVGISVLKPEKKCSAHGHIDDLLPDASRKRAERLILASKRSWAKWPRSGKGSLRRRRAKKMNTILAVPRQTPATNEPSQAFASGEFGRVASYHRRAPSAEGRRQNAALAHEGPVRRRGRSRPCLGFENAGPRHPIHRCCNALYVTSYSRPRRLIRSSASITQTPHSRHA